MISCQLCLTRDCWQLQSCACKKVKTEAETYFKIAVTQTAESKQRGDEEKKKNTNAHTQSLLLHTHHSSQEKASKSHRKPSRSYLTAAELVAEHRARNISLTLAPSSQNSAMIIIAPFFLPECVPAWLQLGFRPYPDHPHSS